MPRFAAWLMISILVATSTATLAHDDHEHEHPSVPSSVRTVPAITDQRGLILPETEGKSPWSDKPVLNDPQRFQIAIMTDNTGGHRPGVWMHAVRNLNLLRPEFVMSVGDLIEGYTTDVEVIESQWKEFLGFIDQMEMKFFFVAGNHDVTNPVMHKIWRDHFGKEWYSFDYKQVHFLCLCSEDPESRIGDKQLEWIRSDLSQHRDARWTFVFLHKPLWTYAENELAAGNPDPTNWKAVEALLADRPHNVFAGHTHNYVQFSRNQTKYYQFATTGGASPLRGPKYGEFDHVIWLTMEKDGPHLANILLDGVLPPDIVTEEKISQLGNLLSKTKLEVEPILIRNRKDLTRGELKIRMKNGLPSPVSVSAKISGFPLFAENNVHEALNFKAQPDEAIEYTIAFEFPSPIGLNHFTETTLTATVTSLDETATVAEVTVPVIIDEVFVTSRALSVPVVDGSLAEWPLPQIATRQRPILLGATENWQGPEDCSLKFQTAYDENHVFLYGSVQDERLIRGKESLVVRLDPRPTETRTANPKPVRGVFEIQCLTHPDRPEFRINVETHGGTKPTEEIQSALQPVEDGYNWELAIPRSYFTSSQSDSDASYQMTIAVSDVDSPEDTPVYVIWRGTREILESNVGLGTFVIER